MNKVFILAMFLFVGGCSLWGNQQNTDSSLSGNNQENIGTNDTGGPRFVPGAPKSTGDQSLSGQTQDEPKPKIDVSNIKHQKDFEYGFWTDGENIYLTGEILSGVKADGFRILFYDDEVIGGLLYYYIANNLGLYKIESYYEGVKVIPIGGSFNLSKLQYFDGYQWWILFKDNKDIYKIDENYNLVGFGVDIDTFKKNKYYYADKNNVYNMLGIITGADVKTFKLIDGDYLHKERIRQYFFKDTDNVYYLHWFVAEPGPETIEKINGISTQGLSILSDHVIKDKNNVMICGFRENYWVNLTGADTSSFKKIKGFFENQDGALYEDKNSGYYGPGDEPKMNKIDLSIINILKTSKNIGGNYYMNKDKNIYYLVYMQNNIIIKLNNVDNETFKVDKDGETARDKNNQRVNGNLVKK